MDPVDFMVANGGKYILSPQNRLESCEFAPNTGNKGTFTQVSERMKGDGRRVMGVEGGRYIVYVGRERRREKRRGKMKSWNEREIRWRKGRELNR